MLAGTFFTSESAYDVFLPEFEAIVALSEIVLPFLLKNYEGSDPRFSIDSKLFPQMPIVLPENLLTLTFPCAVGIVAGIFLVGSRCRVDPVRQRAIELLFSSNYREGIWDSLAVGHMAQWLRSLEVDGLAEGAAVPEEKRAVLNAVNIDLHNKVATVGAVQRTKEGAVQSEALLTW